MPDLKKSTFCTRDREMWFRILQERFTCPHCGGRDFDIRFAVNLYGRRVVRAGCPEDDLEEPELTTIEEVVCVACGLTSTGDDAIVRISQGADHA